MITDSPPDWNMTTVYHWFSQMIIQEDNNIYRYFWMGGCTALQSVISTLNDQSVRDQ